jgi:hypothetical protein
MRAWWAELHAKQALMAVISDHGLPKGRLVATEIQIQAAELSFFVELCLVDLGNREPVFGLTFALADGSSALTPAPAVSKGLKGQHGHSLRVNLIRHDPPRVGV